MCLAIFKPPGKDVSDDHLKRGWKHNPGGAGFAYVKGKKVHVEKGFMKLTDFLAAYEAASKKNKKSPFLIHFRIPSMGDNTAVNTHPFTFEHGALIHNGTIYGTGAAHGTGPSDTCKFVERFGSKLTFNNVKEHNKDIGEALGYNRIAILYHSGDHQILNEEDGIWVNGAWFSNKHFLPPAERIGA